MFVYWIRYEKHTNPYKEGYIGVSSEPTRRLEEHSNFTKCNPKLKNALNKGASMVILKKCKDEKEALRLEEHYRPEDMIGWNIVKGGGKPPSKKDFDFTQTKVCLKGEQRTEKQKTAAEEHSQRMRGRTTSRKGTKLSEEHRKALMKPKSKFAPLKEHKCPHCDKVGKGSSMMRWHFDNCKNKKWRKFEAGN